MAKAMQRALAGLISTAWISFVDDILVFGKDIEEHNEHLKDVRRRLQDVRFKLAIKKCHFAQKEMDILGHKVSGKGISFAPEKTKALVNKKIPSNITELHSFLGFASYFRKFLKDYSDITLPLQQLLRKKLNGIGQRSTLLLYRK